MYDDDGIGYDNVVKNDDYDDVVVVDDAMPL